MCHFCFVKHFFLIELLVNHLKISFCNLELEHHIEGVFLWKYQVAYMHILTFPFVKGSKNANPIANCAPK